MRQLKQIAVGLFLITLSWAANLHAAALRIGTATADITPSPPAALAGQFELRIAHTAATPLTANVVALESSEGDRSPGRGDFGLLRSCRDPELARPGPRRGAQTSAQVGCE